MQRSPKECFAKEYSLCQTEAAAYSDEKEMVANDDNLIAQLSEFCELQLGLGCGP